MDRKMSNTALGEPGTLADPDVPREVDFSGGVRGKHWPTDPAEALPKALARLQLMQQTARQLRDDNERLRGALENLLRLLGPAGFRNDRPEVSEAMREIRRVLDDTREDVPAAAVSG